MTEITKSGAPTRDVDGQTLPIAGAWIVDPAHSSIGFVARHLMVAKVRGRFAEWSADVTIGERPERTTVSVTLQAGSITTGVDQRDEHLRGPDFLDAASHPLITFRSTAVSPGGSSGWRLDGDLGIRGVTKAVTLDAEFGGVMPTPWGTHAAAFEAVGEFDRRDWGLVWNQPLEFGGVLVGDKIRVEVELELLPPAT